MPGMTEEIKKLLYDADRFIQNGQGNQIISDAMASIGFVAANWAEGQTKVDELKAAAKADGDAHAVQLGITDDFNAKFDQSWEQAQTLAKLWSLLFDGSQRTINFYSRVLHIPVYNNLRQVLKHA